MLDNILEKYPRSELTKYGEWLELLFRIEKGAGCYKVTGTIDQVKQAVDLLILKHNKINHG